MAKRHIFGIKKKPEAALRANAQMELALAEEALKTEKEQYDPAQNERIQRKIDSLEYQIQTLGADAIFFKYQNCSQDRDAIIDKLSKMEVVTKGIDTMRDLSSQTTTIYQWLKNQELLVKLYNQLSSEKDLNEKDLNEKDLNEKELIEESMEESTDESVYSKAMSQLNALYQLNEKQKMLEAQHGPILNQLFYLELEAETTSSEKQIVDHHAQIIKLLEEKVQDKQNQLRLINDHIMPVSGFRVPFPKTASLPEALPGTLSLPVQKNVTTHLARIQLKRPVSAVDDKSSQSFEPLPATWEDTINKEPEEKKRR